jgi:hypothetical protein
MSNIIKAIMSGARFRVSLPFISYEVNLNDLVDSSNVDKRISKLGEIKRDLEAAVVAVDSLQSEAATRKTEANQLSNVVERLNEERTTAEALLKLPEDSFTRLMTKANSKGRWRGLFEGALIGFDTGILSSYLVWYLTK